MWNLWCCPVFWETVGYTVLKVTIYISPEQHSMYCFPSCSEMSLCSPQYKCSPATTSVSVCEGSGRPLVLPHFMFLILGPPGPMGLPGLPGTPGVSLPSDIRGRPGDAGVPGTDGSSGECSLKALSWWHQYLFGTSQPCQRGWCLSLFLSQKEMLGIAPAFTLPQE